MKCEGCEKEVAWRDSEGPMLPMKNTWCKECWDANCVEDER